MLLRGGAARGIRGPARRRRPRHPRRVPDGELAGWAWIWNPPSTLGRSGPYLHGEVDPAHRGRASAGRCWRGAWPGPRSACAAGTTTSPATSGSTPSTSSRPATGCTPGWGSSPSAGSRSSCALSTDLPAVDRSRQALMLVPWPDDRDEELASGAQRRLRRSLGLDAGGRRELAAASRGATAPGRTSPSSPWRGPRRRVVALCLNHAYPEDDELTGRREAWIENLATVRSGGARRGVGADRLRRSRSSPRTASRTPCSASTPTTPRARPASTGLSASSANGDRSRTRSRYESRSSQTP